MRRSYRYLFLFPVLLILLISVPVAVKAGPLESFVESPIPYWYDYSNDTVLSWNSTAQTVLLVQSDLNESDSYYYEDMSVVSDWSIWYGDGLQTDGSVGYLEILGDDDYDAVYTNDISMDDAKGYRFDGRFKSNRTSTDVYVRTHSLDNHAGDSQLVVDKTNLGTSWWYFNVTINKDDIESLSFGGRHDSGDIKLEVDWLRIIPYFGELDIRIPILQDVVQEISTSVDVDSGDYIRFGFSKNNITSGMYVDVSNDTVLLNSVGGFGQTSIDYSGIVLLEFFVNEDHNLFTINIKESDGTYLERWESRFCGGGNNQFYITSSNFTNSCLLYHLSGDLDYSQIVSGPEWDISGSFDTDVDMSLLSLKYEDISGGVDHTSTEYMEDIEYLQYLRTEWEIYQFAEYSNDIMYNIYNSTIWVVIGDEWVVSAEFYLKQWWWSSPALCPAEYLSTEVKIANSSGVVWSVFEEGERSWGSVANEEWEFYAAMKFMVWRTQEDKLGVMVWGEATPKLQYGGPSLFTSNVYDEYLFQPYTVGEALDIQVNTTYITRDTVDDWTSDLYFYNDIAEDVDSVGNTYMVSYPYCEYNYFVDSGVSSPHFSTVWWMGGASMTEHTPRWTIENPNLYTGNPILDLLFGDKTNPFVFLIDQVRIIFEDFAGVLWSGLGAAVIPIIQNIVAWAAAGVEVALNGFGEMWFNNATLGTDFIAFVVGSVALFGSVFTFLGWFVTNFVFIAVQLGGALDALAWSLTFYIQPLFWWIVIAVLASSFLMALKHRDIWVFFWWAGLIIDIFKFMFGLFFKLVNYVTSIIVNIIPFT